MDEFDFWLGTWQGVWDGGEATNTITKIMDGRVILEQFRMPGFEGMSVSVYDPEEDVWRQTWVDSVGDYLDFVGGRVDGGMELRREAPGGLFRMLWHEIEPDRFSWRWERSTDGGTTWEPRWLIAYERAPNRTFTISKP